MRTTRHIPSRLLGPAAAVAAALAASCGSVQRTAPSAARPADFTLGVTVYSPVTDPGQAERLARPLRPARYIIEADGVLRAAVGPGADTQTFPPQTRQLTPPQLDGLWRLLADSGLLDEHRPVSVGGADTYTPPRGRTVALVAVAHEGRRDVVAVPLDRAGADADAAGMLVNRLAALAWLRE